MLIAELIEMFTQTKVGLSASLAAIGGVITALVADATANVASVPTPQTVDNAFKFAAVAIITAVGSIVTPILMQIIKTWGDTEIRELRGELREAVKDLTEVKADRDEVARTRREAEIKAHEAELAAERYKARLEVLETRTDVVEARSVVNTERTTALAKVISKDAMNPIAAIVTDAYGKILSITGQIEFILHWKPEELVGENIRRIIPQPLHPDPVHHTDRSFDPSLKFHDKAFRGIPALTKSGEATEIDVQLTRWFERGKAGKIEGVRFGKLIRKYVTNLKDEGFPDPESILPGFVREEIAKSAEAVSDANEKLDDVKQNLDSIAAINAGIESASK